MRMQKYKLEELGEFKNGVNFSSDKMGSGFPLVNVKDVTDNCLINDDRLAKVNLDLKPDSDYIAKEGDLFFVRSSVKFEGAGKVGLIRNLKEDTTHCGFIIRYRLTNKNIAPLFLLYLFNAPRGRERLRNLASGATIFNISQTSLKTLEIEAPPLPTQLKITSILSAYDDLIENNLKRIKLLEEKAFLRYKGIMREEKLEERSILNICYVTDGTHDSPKQQVDGFYLVTGKHLIGGFIDFSSAYFISEADHDKIQKRSKVTNGDLVLSNIGTIGNVAIIDSPFEFSVKNVIIFKPYDSLYISFLYCYLNSNEMQTRFQQESSGTSQRFISLAYTRALKVKLPNQDALKEFHQEVSSLLKLKSILNQQNTKLREARDILLLKLMNGQIVV